MNFGRISKLIPQVTPFNAGELKVLEGTHGTNPMELLGGEMVLEKQTNTKKYIKQQKMFHTVTYKKTYHWMWNRTHVLCPFHKSWAQGTNHRDCSIHLRPTPTPNFLRSFLLAQNLGARA